jgi:hypothetical protein
MRASLNAFSSHSDELAPEILQSLLIHGKIISVLATLRLEYPGAPDAYL